MAKIDEEVASLINLETNITKPNNKVAKFCYTDKAYSDNDVNGVTEYNFTKDQNIPANNVDTLTTNTTLLDKGFRTQASSLPRMLTNHLWGRTSYNLNKIHDWFLSFLKTFKSDFLIHSFWNLQGVSGELSDFNTAVEPGTYRGMTFTNIALDSIPDWFQQSQGGVADYGYWTLIIEKSKEFIKQFLFYTRKANGVPEQGHYLAIRVMTLTPEGDIENYGTWTSKAVEADHAINADNAKDIADNSVTTEKISDEAVTTSKIKAGNVTTSRFASDAVAPYADKLSIKAVASTDYDTVRGNSIYSGAYPEHGPEGSEKSVGYLLNMENNKDTFGQLCILKPLGEKANLNFRNIDGKGAEWQRVATTDYVKDFALQPMKQTLTVVNTKYTDTTSIDLMTRSGVVGYVASEIKETFSTSLAVGDYVTLKLTSSTGKKYIGLQQVAQINKDKKGVATKIYVMPRSYYIENWLPANSTMGDKKIAVETEEISYKDLGLSDTETDTLENLAKALVKKIAGKLEGRADWLTIPIDFSSDNKGTITDGETSFNLQGGQIRTYLLGALNGIYSYNMFEYFGGGAQSNFKCYYTIENGKVTNSKITKIATTGGTIKYAKELAFEYITEPTSINDLKDVGCWRVTYRHADKLLDLPPFLQNESYYRIQTVLYSYGGDGQQIVLTYSGKIGIRSINNDTFQNWVEIPTTEKAKTIATEQVNTLAPAIAQEQVNDIIRTKLGANTFVIRTQKDFDDWVDNVGNAPEEGSILPFGFKYLSVIIMPGSYNLKDTIKFTKNGTTDLTGIGNVVIVDTTDSTAKGDMIHAQTYYTSGATISNIRLILKGRDTGFTEVYHCINCEVSGDTLSAKKDITGFDYCYNVTSCTVDFKQNIGYSDKQIFGFADCEYLDHCKVSLHSTTPTAENLDKTKGFIICDGLSYCSVNEAHQSDIHGYSYYGCSGMDHCYSNGKQTLNHADLRVKGGAAPKYKIANTPEGGFNRVPAETPIQ